MPQTLVPVAGEVRRLTGELFEQIAGDGSTNVVCSGLGLWCGLGVLAAGSEGETANELSKVLGVSPPQAPALIAQVDDRLQALGGATHALALWSRIPVYKAFRESMPNVGFGHLDDDTDLDAWTREHTHDMIERFPVAITDQTLLALADAIALWTQWVTPFDADRTADEPFNAASGSGDVAMMSRRASTSDVTLLANTARFDLQCAVSLGAEESEARSSSVNPVMRFGLGEIGVTPTDVLAAVLSDATGERPSEDFVDVHLPRFSLAGDHDLVPVLQAMGVQRAFTDDAELGRLSPEPLAVDQARQTAVIEVDEVGVKAAAVTAFAMRAGAMFTENPRIMDLRFDRPFAFALIDPELDLPLFAGWVADPRG